MLDDEPVREGCDLPYVLRTAGLDASVSGEEMVNGEGRLGLTLWTCCRCGG